MTVMQWHADQLESVEDEAAGEEGDFGPFGHRAPVTPPVSGARAENDDFGAFGHSAPVTPPASAAERDERLDDPVAEDLEEEAGAQSLSAPRAPTRAEWERHVVSHIPFRSWCRHCVAGRGLERRHLTRQGGTEDTRPHISIDYAYLAGDATPLLIGKDRWTGMAFAMAVERKGAADPHAVTKLTEWVDALGSMKVSIRSDGEPSIMQVAEAVRDARRVGSVTTLETSAPGDHAGNGVAERAVETVGGLVRTLRAELEYNTGQRLRPTSRTHAWIVHHAACLHTLDTVGRDGKVPFQRWMGAKTYSAKMRIR